MVQQSIEDGRCQCAVVVKDFWPFFEHTVGSDYRRSIFVALTDDLEQQVTACFIDQQITEFVQEQHPGSQELAKVFFEPAGVSDQSRPFLQSTPGAACHRTDATDIEDVVCRSTTTF